MEARPVEILLAEDNEDDVLMIREAFEKARLLNRLNVVEDGEEALAYLRREPPFEDAAPIGLVLLDINMPRRNGFEALQDIKGDARLRHVPVIMLTTSKREEDVVRSYAEGACSFVTKPVNCHDFREVVERFELYWTLVSRIPTPTA